MSSSLDSGYYASKAAEAKKEKCDDAPNGKHDWIKHGSWPSLWEECSHCEQTIYWK